MTLIQAQTLRADVLAAFPCLQEVSVTRSAMTQDTYFVGVWYNGDVLLTVSSEHQFKNLIAFIERAACTKEVAS